MRVNTEEAARRAQVSPAQLHERHARLMRDAERVMASIALESDEKALAR
jgi:hypothetical protein